MRKALSILAIAGQLLSCTKPAMSHNVRVITFAVNEHNEYVKPTNTVVYLNQTNVVCFPDSTYGYNTNPTFSMNGLNYGDELHIISFVQAGDPIQYKTVVVYVDNKMVYNASNQVNIDSIIKLK